jgi:putative ABC transport system substrate-binding protein
MRRRDFITLLGSTVAAIAWPLAARAQHSAMPVIGFLGVGSPDKDASRVRAFRQGLGETGYFEGQNVEIEYRWAKGQDDQLPALAAELVQRQVTVIASEGGVASALAAKAATATIPIVFQLAADPVEIGLVASLNRPGGNLTGVTSLSAEVGPKRLELLHELVPTARMFALLINPASPINADIASRDLRKGAAALGLELRLLQASTDADFDTVFATLLQERAGGLLITPDVFFTSRSEQLGALALRHAVPAVFAFRDFAAAGGLLSYGGSFTDVHRQVGVYTGRILKGEKPADLPVVRSTKVELVINLKTAKALGVTVPLSLIGRADEVIE